MQLHQNQESQQFTTLSKLRSQSGGTSLITYYLQAGSAV